MLGKILIKNKKKHHHHRPSSGGSIRRREPGEQSSPNNGTVSLCLEWEWQAVVALLYIATTHWCPVFVIDCPLTDGEGSHLLSNGEEKLAERMVKDSEPRKSLGGLEEEEWVVDLERLGVRGWFCGICCCHIPPGGEGESEEDEEDEPVTDLKKPNTDEVKGTRSSTHGVWLANGLIDGSVVCASLRVLPAVRWTPRRRCQLLSTTLNLSNSRALRWQPVSVCVGEMKRETESSQPC